MLKVDWLRHPATGVAIFAAVGLVVAALNNEGAVPGARGDQSTQYQLERTPNSGIAPQAAHTYPSRHTEEWRHQKDLEAQQQMAFWGMAMFFVTACGVWFVAKTLDATKNAAQAAHYANIAALRAIDVTKDAAEMQSRAYLIPQYARVFFVKETNLPDLKIGVKNFGETPAHTVLVGAKIAFGRLPKHEDPIWGTYATLKDLGRDDFDEGRVTLGGPSLNIKAFIEQVANSDRFMVGVQVILTYWLVSGKSNTQIFDYQITYGKNDDPHTWHDARRVISTQEFMSGGRSYIHS